MEHLDQIIQVAGSLLILSAFALAQWGVLDPKTFTYLVLNVTGSAVLAVEAALGQQWGFLLLEGVWAIVSAIGLITLIRKRATRNSGEPGKDRKVA